MKPRVRAVSRCVLGFVLLASQTAPGVLAAPPAAAPISGALPPLPPQDNPWLYRGSDVPHDKEWVFGTLPNGLRWAVRRNGVPPGQVSIRIRMDVGSLYEQPAEAGFAHLLEHLVFRQSKYLGEAQAIPTWQRLGASFGTDTNAETSPTMTDFKIDLPDASPAALDESFKLLSGMMEAPTLSESDIRTEVPIVLAEKREHGGAAERVADAMRETLFAGQPLADHATIGSIETIEGAHQDAVRAFHDRWYRPENAAIIAAGDADPALLAALIAKWFGGWHPAGGHVAAPDFGAPSPPPGSDPDNPVGLTRVLVEPGLPRSLAYAVVRPWHEKNDTIVYNEGLMIDQVAQAIINRRLEQRARAGASYLTAQVGQENISRSIDGTFVTISPLDAHWQAALHDVRQVIADALAHPPTPEEIAREVAEINVSFESQVEQRTLAPGGKLSDDLVQALDIHETVAAPEVVLDIFKRSIPLFTPEAVLAHSRKLFAGTAIRALYVTPATGEADAAKLRAALLEPIRADGHIRVEDHPISFADQPAIGAPGTLQRAIPTGLLNIEQLNFANGVKAIIWPTQDDPGRVTVKVRFGGGYNALTGDDAPYVALAPLALVSSGEGRLGQEQLDEISTGRKLGFDFAIGDGAFTFSADTRREDLADQLYLFAAKLAMPRWDAEPVLRAKAAARLQLETEGASPDGVLARDLKWLQRDRDPRFRAPSDAELAAATPQGFRKVWAPLLASGPIEVQVFGDFDRAAVITALSATFGALAPRRDVAVPPVAVHFPAPAANPVVLTDRGDANQAAAVVSWPTGGGESQLRESRQLGILAQLFWNRLLASLREKMGASYAPQVSADWPMDLDSGGTITAQAQLTPQMAPRFFAAVDQIAGDLRAAPPGADELALVTEPLRQQLNRAATGTAFFMWQLEGATLDPRRYGSLGSIMPDSTRTTPAEMQALAQKYLVPGKALRVEVLPATAPPH
ncbi:MAG: insulinase family protein [Sphingomonadales bacterium]|nr:insulinase family protein [Sphingomonadales bacterium]